MRYGMPNKLSPLLLCLLVFCLTACANKHTEPIALPEPHPFAATGLLAHPGETAEEILVRAHTYDSEAVALAATGYLFGISGFPQDENLALSWYGVGAVQMPHLMGLFDIMRSETFGSGLEALPEQCYDAQRSVLAPLFKNAGIFDVEARCAHTKTFTSPYIPDRAGSPAEIKTERNNTLRNLLAKAIDRPLTRQDTEFLKGFLSQYNKNLLVNYIGAGGKKGFVSAEERNRNLLRFIARRKTESFPESKTLHDFAVQGLMFMNFGQASVPFFLDVIRKAHAGDSAAMLHMVENYRTGAMGFCVNPNLSISWMQHAAKTGDGKAWNALSLWYYVDSFMGYAWLNAQIGLHHGSPETHDQLSWIIREAENHLKPDDLKELRQTLEQELRRIEASGIPTR